MIIEDNCVSYCSIPCFALAGVLAYYSAPTLTVALAVLGGMSGLASACFIRGIKEVARL
jgi:hypothetical protein